MAGALNRLRWLANRALEGGGAPAVTALVLALVALLAWFASVEPLAARLLDVRRGNAQLTQRVAAAAALPPKPAPATEAERLASFVAAFPSDKDIPAAFSRLHALAARHGVPLAQAEFRLSAQSAEPLARYAMVLPVKTDYARLRAFVDDVLRDMPSVALEELSLRRDDLRTELIDARLRLVLFLSRGA